MEWVSHFIPSHLGMIIDNNLTFNLTIEQMHRKVAFRLKTFKSLRNNLTTHSALIFAKSLILPYIDYGLFLLSDCHDKHLSKLQTLQNRFLKAALGVGRLYNTRHLHHRCNILLVKDRIILQQLKLIHRSRILGINTFPKKGGSSATRSSNTIQLELCTPQTEMCRKNINYKGVREYNLLPKLKNASLNSFGTKLKRHYLSAYLGDA